MHSLCRQKPAPGRGLLSNDGEAAWSDCHGRRPDRLNLTGVGRKRTGSFEVPNGIKRTFVLGDASATAVSLTRATRSRRSESSEGGRRSPVHDIDQRIASSSLILRPSSARSSMPADQPRPTILLPPSITRSWPLM